MKLKAKILKIYYILVTFLSIIYPIALIVFWVTSPQKPGLDLTSVPILSIATTLVLSTTLLEKPYILHCKTKETKKRWSRLNEVKG